jgi:vacuolar-type H+-ATPase subunit H
METAKQEASNVAGTAKDEAKHVARTAKEEAKEVGREARTQVSRLYDEARTELSDQAAHRQDRLAQGLRSASDELQSMASSSTNGGVATDLVRQAATRLNGAASWLGDRQPGDVLEEVKRYARRRPVVFLGLAALAGVVVGRLTRSIAAGEPESDYTPRRGITGSTGLTYGDADLAYGGAGTSTSTYGDTPVYDASAGRTGTGVGTGVGTGTVIDAADDVNDPLHRPEERG